MDCCPHCKGGLGYRKVFNVTYEESIDFDGNIIGVDPVKQAENKLVICMSCDKRFSLNPLNENS